MKILKKEIIPSVFTKTMSPSPNTEFPFRNILNKPNYVLIKCQTILNIIKITIKKILIGPVT